MSRGKERPEIGLNLVAAKNSSTTMPKAEIGAGALLDYLLARSAPAYAHLIPPYPA
jgi:hypothetical protein